MNKTKQKPFSPSTVRSNLAPLTFTGKKSLPAPLKEYLDYYRLNMEVPHHIGTFFTQDFTCAAQVFIPKNARGTVFLLHGLYDHTGILTNIIHGCIEKQFAVAVFDLPGHGLSTGVRASIDSFSHYVTAFRDFFSSCKSKLQGPYFLIGHSTGAAVAFEYLYHTDKQPYKKIILIAPLIRCSFYHLSRIGYSLITPVHSKALKTRRWLRRASSDKEFLRFFRNDPLQCHHFPIQWAKAYYYWLKKIKQYETINADVSIIQGTKDTTVDRRYNIPWLQKIIPKATVTYIKGARHQLMNEGEPFLSEFITALHKELDSQ